MATCSLALFFVALVLVRISGRCSLARRSAFDNIIVIALGAVLSRPIYGASSFWPVVSASMVLAVIHRLTGLATAKLAFVERRAKGKGYTPWTDGRLDERAMLRNEISRGDLDAAARSQAHHDRFAEVAEIHRETSGELSIVDHRLGRA